MMRVFSAPRLLLSLSLLIHFQAQVFGQPESMNTRILTGPLLDSAEVKPGEKIPEDLVVYSESGEKKTLLEVVNGRYTVLVSGCLTCPIFHRTYPEIEAVYRDYRDTKDLQFFYLYKSLAHPEYDGYIRPVTLRERLDGDGDGFLDEAEIDAFVARIQPPQGGPRGNQGPGGSGRGAPGGRQGGDQADRMMNFDSDGDGKLTRGELPEPMREQFGRLDVNADGFIDEEEIDAMADRIQGGPGPQGRRAQPPGRPSRDNI